FRREIDCYGYIYPPWQYYPPNWYCDNTSVATVDQTYGVGTAVGIGNALIRNPFQAEIYTDGGSECLVDYVTADPAAFCDVVDPQTCPIPRNFRQDGNAQTSGMNMIINYKWDSSTGNLADLSNVTIGERVDYPTRNCGGNLKYCWPSPPWATNAVTDQPTIINLPGATPGVFNDTHESKTFITPYQAASFNATQVYRYRTSCAANNSWVTLATHTIERRVLQEGGQWKYRITKGNNIKTFNLP
ncbi:MAG: Ig-like domain-containing protein, partial [Nitrososphaera sp.]|nr:Ig-like domain-containing protein [Nitrososphaera sp.]